MSDFVSWASSCSFLFHEVTSLHPPSFRDSGFTEEDDDDDDDDE